MSECYEYGYEWDDWELLPDETKDQIIADHERQMAEQQDEGPCGCMGGTR